MTAFASPLLGQLHFFTLRGGDPLKVRTVPNPRYHRHTVK